MKRTSAGVLILAAVVGIGAGFLLDNVLSASGQPTFVPAVTLPVLLLVLGGIVVVLAIPIARITRGRRPGRVDPFRAVRIAMLAKASAMVGAVSGGFGVGLLVFLLSRPVTPSLGSMEAVIATAAAGVVLVVAGLVAEYLCTIRKDDDDEQPGDSAPGVGSGSH